MTRDVEEWFAFEDDGLTFHVLEGEDGDAYWCYGHVSDEYIVFQTNRWLLHLGMEINDLLIAEQNPAQRIWAKVSDDEHFRIQDPSGTEADADLFPVTRLIL